MPKPPDCDRMRDFEGIVRHCYGEGFLGRGDDGGQRQESINRFRDEVLKRIPNLWQISEAGNRNQFFGKVADLALVIDRCLVDPNDCGLFCVINTWLETLGFVPYVDRGTGLPQPAQDDDIDPLRAEFNQARNAPSGPYLEIVSVLKSYWRRPPNGRVNR